VIFETKSKNAKRNCLTPEHRQSPSLQSRRSRGQSFQNLTINYKGLIEN